MPFTLGFRTAHKRTDHFLDHLADFGVIAESDYESLADAFLGGPKSAATLECVRPRENDIIRYNPITEEYGVLSFDGYIRTYFIPDPAEHGLPTNLDYFYANCALT